MWTNNTRRLRGDQIEVFKILNGYENIDSNIFLEIKESKITRGHNYTLVKKQSRLDVRKYSFSQRTINVWNNLSTDCVQASVNMFKNKIDKLHRCQPSRIRRDSPAFSSDVPRSREISRCPAFFENGIIIFFVADYSTCLPRKVTNFE